MFEKKILGAAVAMLALAWPLTSHADDQTDLDDVKPSQSVPPTKSPGIAPDTSASPPATSTTRTTAADYDERAAAERPSEQERKPNKAMLITGSAIFLGTYAAGAIVASFSDTKGDDNLYIPVVGPWLDLAQRPCSLGECTFREDVNIAHIIGSGAAQAAGIGIALASFFVGERRDGRPAPQPPVTQAHVQVLPVSLRGGAGIGAFGTF